MYSLDSFFSNIILFNRNRRHSLSPNAKKNPIKENTSAPLII